MIGVGPLAVGGRGAKVRPCLHKHARGAKFRRCLHKHTQRGQKNQPFFTQDRILTKNPHFFMPYRDFNQTNPHFLKPNRDFNKQIHTFLRRNKILIKKIHTFLRRTPISVVATKNSELVSVCIHRAECSAISDAYKHDHHRHRTTTATS